LKISRNTAKRAVMFSFIAVVLLSLFRSLEQSPDSLSYATSIRSGEGMFHPHHILFAPAVKAIYLFLSICCSTYDAIISAQIHNILWASLATAGAYIATQKVTGSAFIAGATSSLFLISNGFWLFSTQTEVYVPATAPLIMLTALLLESRGKIDLSQTIFSIILLSLAVLYHQSNVLFCIPLFFLVGGGDSGTNLKRYLSIILPAGLLTLIFYLSVFIASGAEFSFSRFISFCIPYASHPNPEWGTFANFSFTGIGRLLDSQLRDIIYIPGVSSLVRYAAVGTFSLFLLFLGGAALYLFKRGRLVATSLMFPVVWLTTYYLFNLWWLPGEEELFISTIFPLLLLGGILLKGASAIFLDEDMVRRTKLVSLAIILIVAGINFFMTILPHSSDKGDFYREALAINKLERNECAVIAGYGVVQNLTYHFDRKNSDEIEAPALGIYRYGKPERVLMPDTDTKCLIVPAKYLSPAYSIASYSGYTNPAEWLKLVEWILGIEYLENGNITHYHFERKGASGEQLVITPGVRENDVLKRLLLKLG